MAVLIAIGVILLVGFIVVASRGAKQDEETDVDLFVQSMGKVTDALNDVSDVATSLSKTQGVMGAELKSLAVVIGREIDLVTDRIDALQTALHNAVAELQAAKGVHLHIAASDGRKTDAKP